VNLFFRAPVAAAATAPGDGTFALGGRERATIGRASTCDLVLSDRSVSRLHATIDACGEAHLLADAGSANGTFLNGLRLDGSTQVVLREGDVIEIGSVRFLYGSDGRCPTPTGQAALTLAETSYPLADLLRDGIVKSAPEGDTERRFLAALAGATRVAGLERCLGVILERLGATVGAVYLAEPRGRLIPIAGIPKLDATRSLAPLAERVWKEGHGLLVRAVTPEDLAPSRDTVCEPVQSTCAVVFGSGPRLLGVLVADRFDEGAFDREDLAHLAVLGERLGRYLVLRGASGQETRGFED
jgi:hypothetical protein